MASGLWQQFPFTHRFQDNSEALIAISKPIVSRLSNLHRIVSTFYRFMCLKWIRELYLKFSWILMIFPDLGQSLLISLRIRWNYWSRFPFARIYRTVREALQNTWNNEKRKQLDCHQLDSEQWAQNFRWFHHIPQLKIKSSVFQHFPLGFTPETFWVRFRSFSPFFENFHIFNSFVETFPLKIDEENIRRSLHSSQGFDKSIGDA